MCSRAADRIPSSAPEVRWNCGETCVEFRSKFFDGCEFVVTKLRLISILERSNRSQANKRQEGDLSIEARIQNWQIHEDLFPIPQMPTVAQEVLIFAGSKWDDFEKVLVAVYAPVPSEDSPETRTDIRLRLSFMLYHVLESCLLFSY